MPLTAYKVLKGSSQTQLSQAVQLELGYPNRVLASNIWSKSGYLWQAVGTGTIEQPGVVSAYIVVTNANDDAFITLVNNQLVAYQPIGNPVVYNNQMYLVMGMFTPATDTVGQPGKTPEIRIGAGYIQWKYMDDVNWNNLIELSALTGPGVRLRNFNGNIEWKPTNEMYWETLVSLDTITGPANTLSVGSVDSGDTPAATITGTPPNQTLNLTLQRGEPGPVNNLSVGIVSTLEPGQPATVVITGDAPSQVINFGIPSGKDTITEIVNGIVETQGTAVALTFTKTYSTPPAVVALPQWTGTQMVTGDATDVTTTGCNFTAIQSTTSGGFEYAEEGKAFSVMIIGN